MSMRMTNQEMEELLAPTYKVGIGTQTKIMDKITDKGGHFCLQLKANQKETFQSVKIYFDDLEKNNSADFEGLECYQDITTKEHGRYENREYRIMSNKDENSKKEND